MNNYESEYRKEQLKWAINRIDLVGCELSQNMSEKLKEKEKEKISFRKNAEYLYKNKIETILYCLHLIQILQFKGGKMKKYKIILLILARLLTFITIPSSQGFPYQRTTFSREYDSILRR